MRRHVLVTGAGSGIGRATALQLARLGFVVTGLVPPGPEGDAQAEELRAAANSEHTPLAVVTADLSIAEQRREVARSMDLWALVNNAGYMNAGQILDVPIADARRQIEAMVLAPVDLIRQAAPAMMGRGHGRIVNITSSAVHTSTPLTGWYQAAKAALRELNDSLRTELAAYGIQVIDVEPGGYRTGIWGRAAAEMAGRRDRSAQPQIYDRVLRRIDDGYRLMADPAAVGLAVADALTTGVARRHIRIGPGARVLRSADRLVPDGLWDRAVSAVAGVAP